MRIYISYNKECLRWNQIAHKEYGSYISNVAYLLHARTVELHK
jgi:hypothetical protein